MGIKIIDKKGHGWRGPGNQANMGQPGGDESGGDGYQRKSLKAKSLERHSGPTKPPSQGGGSKGGGSSNKKK